MARKSKQAGSGHMPLTHYERTKKFASSGFGTTTTRLSGDTQVSFGHCALSLSPIVDDTAASKGDGDDATITTIAMVTPSGHMYGKEAIYEYLLTKTQDYQEAQAKYDTQQDDHAKAADTTESDKRKRQDFFDESQSLTKRNKTVEVKEGLKRTSYWLPDMQPDKVELQHAQPDRPSSPYSGDPLRRKDLRPVALPRKASDKQPDGDVICAISGKPIRLQPAIAYWTKDKKEPGVVVLKQVYDMTIDTDSNKKKKPRAKGGPSEKKAPALLCPLTNNKIKHTIELKTGGSGFAAHNDVQVKTYRPTIT